MAATLEEWKSVVSSLVAGTEAAVQVACSTLCFRQKPFEQALRSIAELEFSKLDVAVHEHGGHIKPSEVAADVGLAAQKLRLGPGLTPAAFSVEIEAADEAGYLKQYQAVCRLARISAVPLLTIRAAPADSDFEAEVARLTKLSHLATSDGLILTVSTLTGTLTEDPDLAVELCERVPGLGLTLDPSHYITGPNQGRNYDEVYPYVRHVHLRDTGRGPNSFQVRIGQGEVEYGRILSQLARHHYNRLLTVDVRDEPAAPVSMEPEVRKLKYLLESLV
jgi:sugar phosphate isomerase/epimerase